VAQLVEAGFEELQDRQPPAVGVFVLDEGADLVLVGGPDAVLQVPDRCLVEVAQREFVIGRGASFLRLPPTRCRAGETRCGDPGPPG
jgi:hypothetical protein